MHKLIASVVQATALAFFLVVAPIGAQAAEPAFPALTGRVVDAANLIPDDREAAISAKLEALEAKTGDQLVVVTVNSLQDQEIEDYGYQLGRKWGIGQKGVNSGVLFIIAPNERKTRIEVGYGLEPVLTDALSSVILQEKVLPEFRQGRFADGIDAGVDSIVGQLSLPREEAIAKAQKAAAKPKARINPWAALFTGFIIFFVLTSFLSAAGRGRRRGRGGGGMDGLLPIILWSALSRGDGGGGGWSGGGGGGGFSGGGGSFGGGGASGGW